MMKTIEIAFEASASGATKVYLPMKDPCRLISGYIGVSTQQDNTAYLVKIGKEDEAQHILEADLDSENVDAGETIKLTFNDSASEVQKKQIFDTDTPIEIEVANLQNASMLVFQLIVDPFLIGAHEGLSS